MRVAGFPRRAPTKTRYVEQAKSIAPATFVSSPCFSVWNSEKCERTSFMGILTQSNRNGIHHNGFDRGQRAKTPVPARRLGLRGPAAPLRALRARARAASAAAAAAAEGEAEGGEGEPTSPPTKWPWVASPMAIPFLGGTSICDRFVLMFSRGTGV